MRVIWNILFLSLYFASFMCQGNVHGLSKYFRDTERSSSFDNLNERRRQYLKHVLAAKSENEYVEDEDEDYTYDSNYKIARSPSPQILPAHNIKRMAMDENVRTRNARGKIGAQQQHYQNPYQYHQQQKNPYNSYYSSPQHITEVVDHVFQDMNQGQEQGILSEGPSADEAEYSRQNRKSGKA